ncbi:MAG: ribosomal-protein-alanine acetyltransferase [Robiginitomaculum sp.]|nr:MAG: ribosomal-protein-alanine acetyltransferase [Robiginitomaculum sp.]
MGVRAKIVGPEQAERLTKIHARCFDASWSIKEFAKLLANPAVQAIVLVEDDRDTGMALLQNLAGETEILTFGIIRARRGNGMGYRLLQAISDLARAGASRSIFLEVSKGNKAATHLYAGFGFEQVGLRKDYYADGSDAFICRLSLLD